MSLEPIQFHKKNSQKVTNTLSTLSKIKKIIQYESGVTVQIRKLNPPKLVLTVKSSSEASELNLSKLRLLKGLAEFHISNIQIITR